jgi:hypothetical protein
MEFQILKLIKQNNETRYTKPQTSATEVICNSNIQCPDGISNVSRLVTFVYLIISYVYFCFILCAFLLPAVYCFTVCVVLCYML